MGLDDKALQGSMPARKKHGIVLLIFLAVGAVGASFLWQGHMGISTGDEGYLWYGAQRVLLGDVPLRDFMSYDPGRYYWAAMVMALGRNNGIIALRIAGAIFQAMGLFIGLLLLDRGAPKTNLRFLLLETITLLFWMFPWFKQYDITISIALIGALSLMIQRPTPLRYFSTGLFVGLVAAFSRYHGLFGVVGNLGVIVYLQLKRENGRGFVKCFSFWSVGVVTGYLPIFLMMAFIPGFAMAFLKDIHASLFELNGAFISLPVPWPWRVPFGQVSLGAGMRGVLTGVFFIALIIYCVSSLTWVVFQKLHKKRPVSPVFVASAFLALPYAFYTFSCPDISRLPLGIFPFLIGVLLLLENRPSKFKWIFASLLCVATLLVMLPNHPGWARKQYVQSDVGGSKLKIYPADAKYFTMLGKLVNEYAPEGRSFIALPYFPSAYAAFRRKAPVFEIYQFLPRNAAFQLTEIEKIKSADPGFAMICDVPLFGQEKLRFRNTHPLIFQYILDHFEPLSSYTSYPEYSLYKSKKNYQVALSKKILLGKQTTSQVADKREIF